MKFIKNIINFLNKLFRNDFLIITTITLFLFTFLNFIFVYNSARFLKYVPNDMIMNISSCYRSLLDLSKKQNLKKVNFVFGDSYSEGMGEEFLKSDPEYGIFNKLTNVSSTNLIFGRSGYGSLDTLNEFNLCLPLLSSFTNLSIADIKSYDITFVFYEGNDLNDNLRERGSQESDFRKKIKFLLPLYTYSYYKIINFFNKKSTNEIIVTQPHPPQFSLSNISIGIFPQSAATELNLKELQTSIGILKNSLELIRANLSYANTYRLLYLPSVVSSYHFDGVIRAQSYKGADYFETTGEFNLSQSLLIRNMLKELSLKLDWIFCDTTDSILNMTNNGKAVHGPLDWKHFNKLGYSIVAQDYLRCFGE